MTSTRSGKKIMFTADAIPSRPVPMARLKEKLGRMFVRSAGAPFVRMLTTTRLVEVNTVESMTVTRKTACIPGRVT
jgi:hypothetical protein